MSEITLPRGVKNLIGLPPFGRLTAVSFAGMVPNGDYHLAVWKCECSCGGTKTVKSNLLISGGVQSCGCIKREQTVARNTTHGLSRHPMYSLYCGIKERCLNANASNFHNYGDRGISICERWIGPNGFVNFLADMGERPSKRHSVERKQNNLGYSPENCEWALRTQQSRNTRVNHLLTFEGETLCLADWAERKGMKYMTLFMRLKRGMSTERALTTPVMA